MAHGHHVTPTEPPSKVTLPGWFQPAAIAAIVVGLAAFGYQFSQSPELAWKGYLIGLVVVTSLTMFGPFFTSTQYLTRAGWSVTMRRIPEAFGTFIAPAGVLAMILAFAGASTLYEWMDPNIVANDPHHILETKTWILNQPAMLACTALFYLIPGVIAFMMYKNSKKQDETGDGQLTLRNARLSPAFLATFALLLTTFSVHFLMSLQPHWFSTMWAVNVWANLFQMGIAVMVILILILHGKGRFGGFVNENHIHDIGKLTFASTAFWAYIAFCQFLLIWYSNLPEEAIFYHPRFTDGWEVASLALPVVKFIIPFFFMLPRSIKRGGGKLLGICVLIFIMTVFEIYWWVAPAPTALTHHFHPHFPFMEALIVVGFLGGFALVVGKAIASANIIPVKDPRLHEALEHHQ